MSIKYIKKLTYSLKEKQYCVFFSDFETTVYKNKHYVTCFVLSSELFSESFSILKYTPNSDIEIESKNLIINFIKSCLFYTKQSKIKTSLVYFHNLGKFDGFFLINCLSLLPDLNFSIITRDNVLYEIKIISDDIEIKFRDSYLLFPISLENLGKLFGENKIKFTEISASFENYVNPGFRNSLLEYCKKDVEILKKSVLWYRDYILKQHNIDLYDSLTLASLAFKIFRTHYYSNAVICQSHSFMDNFIRQSYRGGVVDVYRPVLNEGYLYDINSLYPYIMSISDMPIGPGVYKNIESTEVFDINNFFGFISVKVKAPKDLYLPYLSVRDKELGLISPLGEWTDVYFSEEIKYALTLGYEFEYLSYYKFDKKVIFSDYVNNIYAERIKNKNNPFLSGISKLLLNSLYGRFGMSNSVYKNLFLKNANEDESLLRKIKLIYDAKILNEFKNNDETEENYVSLIRYNEIPDLNYLSGLYQRGILIESAYLDFLKEPNKKTSELNISVHIASAITAYARIYMHKFKMEYKNSLYYSDTDSIILDKELPSHLVSEDKLGLFKLEHKIKKGIFIAPKLYYLETETGVIKKSKGVNSTLLTSEDFLSLYGENSVKVKFLKLFIRNLKTYTISTSETEHELQGNFRKRKKLYDFIGNWIDTKPIKIKH